MSDVLTRPLAVRHLEEGGRFTGYASVFHVRDGQADAVAPGAFARTLADARKSGVWPKLLWQHNPSEPVGVIERLEEDAYGLRLEARLLLDVRRAREAYALLKAGVIDSLSIGFEAVEARRDARTGTRILEEVRLWEISLVTFPANAAARVTDVKASDPWGLVLEGLRKAAAILRPSFSTVSPCKGASA